MKPPTKNNDPHVSHGEIVKRRLRVGRHDNSPFIGTLENEM